MTRILMIFVILLAACTPAPPNDGVQLSDADFAAYLAGDLKVEKPVILTDRQGTQLAAHLAKKRQAARNRDACVITGRSDSCVRVVGCMGQDAQWFVGKARGLSKGTISGRLSSGAMCKGRWARKFTRDLGTATLSCDDGRSTQVQYTYLDAKTGTAMAVGQDNLGGPVTAFAGSRVIEFLQKSGDRRVQDLVCDPIRMALAMPR